MKQTDGQLFPSGDEWNKALEVDLANLMLKPKKGTRRDLFLKATSSNTPRENQLLGEKGEAREEYVRKLRVENPAKYT